MSRPTSVESPALEAKTLGQVFPHHGDSPLIDPYDPWRRFSFDPSLPFPQPSQIPYGCSRVLMRVWDYDSSARLNVYYDSNGKLKVRGGFKVGHEPPLFAGVSRQQALNSHAVYQIYEVCFISTTQSFRDMRQRVRNIYNRDRRVDANPVFITFIDASILSQGPWSVLCVPEEHENYQVPRIKEGNSYGNDEWYKEEVLAIREIPEEAILGTAVAPDLKRDPFPDWDAFEERLKEQLMRKLSPNSTIVINPFVPEQTSLWKS